MPSHWHWVGHKRITEDDKLPGGDHPQSPYRPISWIAMEVSVYRFLHYPWSSDQNKQTTKKKCLSPPPLQIQKCSLRTCQKSSSKCPTQVHPVICPVHMDKCAIHKFWDCVKLTAGFMLAEYLDQMVLPPGERNGYAFLRWYLVTYFVKLNKTPSNVARSYF